MENVDILGTAKANEVSWKQFVQEETGYVPFTTFWSDFCIAEAFGIDAIQDTFNRAFKAAKGDYKYLTELVLVLNHKIWNWYNTNKKIAELYDKLWRQADVWACDNLKGDELEYFYITLD